MSATITASVNNQTASCTVTVKEDKSYSTGKGGQGYVRTVTVNGRTYKIFKQKQYSQYKFWGDGNLADNGCGPTSLTIALSGYYLNITPPEVGDYMEYGTFDRITATAKH